MKSNYLLVIYPANQPCQRILLAGLDGNGYGFGERETTPARAGFGFRAVSVRTVEDGIK